MKLCFILAIVVFLLPKMLSAQQISGIVKDEKGKELPGASIALKKLKDSSVVKLAISRNAGNFQLTDLLPDSYFVTASFIGYADKNSSPFELTEAKNISIPDILLARETGNLHAVTVVSKKPLIEMKADMMVLNVESSINAVGQDALELLRKSPGVTVDRDDNLSLSGKNGVQVYIDGRPTPLAGKDLSSYLKSLQSSSIEAIEIITNPSAKYEAAGNAGIINIRLKKNRSYGTNGSVNAGYAIGMLYPQYNAGFSLNKRNAKVNVFGTYNYNYNRDIMYMDMYRVQLDTLFDQHSSMTYREMGHNIKAGVDYFFNSKSTFGILLN
jgi:iron complex outermembrane receptor protein